MWKSHPKALPYLFLSEMWERFGYYLMIGIFTLYLKDVEAGFAMTEKEAADLYGTFIALVFLTPFIGGLLADRILGYRKSIFLGGSLMADWIPIFYAMDGNYLLISDDVETVKRSIKEKTHKKSNEPVKLNHRFFNWQTHSIRSIPFLMDHSVGIFKKNFVEWVPLFKGVQTIELSDNGEEENDNSVYKDTVSEAESDRIDDNNNKINDDTNDTTIEVC